LRNLNLKIADSPATLAATMLSGLDLPILRTRVTMRLLEDAALPAYKGATLRQALTEFANRVPEVRYQEYSPLPDN
jgi:hypothetical protein